MTERVVPAWQTRPIGLSMVLAMRAIHAVGKTEQNTESPEQFMFRGVDAVVNAVGPVLRRFGILCLPTVLGVTTRDVSTGGRQYREVTVKMRYTFRGVLGDEITVEVAGEALDEGDKATNKAESVAWRIALIQAFCIPTGERDPDLASYRRAAQDQAAEQSQDRPAGRAGQAEPPRDRRQTQWNEIIALGEELGLDLAGVRGDFFRWSGGKQINGPIEETTQEMLTRYHHGMRDRLAKPDELPAEGPVSSAPADEADGVGGGES